jgi:response regulator RpfG family c-di-GMP phosphodiesterase
MFWVKFTPISYLSGRGDLKMSSKILLVGNHADSTREIKKILTVNNLYKVIQATDGHEAVRKLSQDKANLVIFDTEVLTVDKMNFTKALRSLGYAAPVLMLAKAVAPKARDLLKVYNMTVILEKPLEHKHFLGVASKLIEGKEVPQQTYKRFYTNQVTTVEQMGANKKYDCSMLNLSKGGAYLEIADENAEVRGIIKMKVSLDQMDKQYEVNARVVWNSKSTIWGRGQGVGVEFIQAKDVYRNLLNNL